ncbi:MAG TPA: ribosome-binding factor A [Candidatus Paceibacterota bacterium]
MGKKEQRLASTLKDLVSSYLEKEVAGSGIITVTRVAVEGNLRAATIFVTMYPESEEAELLKTIKRRGGDLRAYVKDNVRTKFIPFFQFQIDKGEKLRQRIDELLKS